MLHPYITMLHRPSFITLIDRYHGIDAHIRGTHKKCILLVTGSNPDPSYMDGMRIWFQTDMRYLGWQAAGAVYAHGCTTAAQLKENGFCPGSLSVRLYFIKTFFREAQRKRRNFPCSTK